MIKHVYIKSNGVLNIAIVITDDYNNILDYDLTVSDKLYRFDKSAIKYIISQFKETDDAMFHTVLTLPKKRKTIYTSVFDPFMVICDKILSDPCYNIQKFIDYINSKKILLIKSNNGYNTSKYKYGIIDEGKLIYDAISYYVSEKPIYIAIRDLANMYNPDDIIVL